MSLGVPFPPGNNGVLLPLRSRRTAARGVTLYTASKPIPQALQWSAWAAIRLLGAGVLPWHRERVVVPGLEEVAARIGRIDAVALYRRRDVVRPGATFVAHTADDTTLLVKIRPEGTDLGREQGVLRTVRATSPASFGVPEPLGLGRLADGSVWSAQQMVFGAPHRPCLRLPDGFLADLDAALLAVAAEPGLCPPGRRPGWRLAHGDLTAWNLRRDLRGRLWLFDWEDLCWAPPGADAVYFAATLGVVRRRRGMPPVAAAPAEFWSRRVERRLAEGHPAHDNRLILGRLEEGRSGPGDAPGGARAPAPRTGR